MGPCLAIWPSEHLLSRKTSVGRIGNVTKILIGFCVLTPYASWLVIPLVPAMGRSALSTIIRVDILRIELFCRILQFCVHGRVM